jgi:microcystin-dependent protein
VGSATSQFAGGTSTGSANAQVVASTSPAGFARTPGQVVTFTAGFTNTGSTTLNVDSTGAATVQKTSGGGNVNLTGGEIVAAAFISVIWTGTVYLLQSGTLGALATLNIGQWLKNDGSGNLTIKNGANLGDDGSGNLEVLPQFLPPSGSILPYGGTTAPTGYILAQGQAVSRTGSTATLFSVMGITFGGGDGVTTFNVPDLRGRVPAGVDGGVGRLPGYVLGTAGGQQTNGIAVANMPNVTIPITGTASVSGGVTNGAITSSLTVGNVVGAASNAVTSGANFTVPSNAVVGGVSSTQAASSFSGSGTVTGNTGFLGSATPFTTQQPTMALNYIIKM